MLARRGILRSCARGSVLPGRLGRPARRTLRVKAIGFDFGEARAEAAAKPGPKFKAFGLLSSSLLVLGPVLKGAVGEAFLGVMAAAIKYQASNKDIIAAYARLYQLLLTAGYGSWQDYLLDQLLLGRDNPLARAVAQGTLEEGAPVLQALAYDLDVLQELCIDLQQLADYVGEVAPVAGSYWVAAAGSVSTKRPAAKQLGAGGAGGGGGAAAALDLTERHPYIQAPASSDELAQWRAAIASHAEWGKAVPLLQAYFSAHGFGVTSRNAALRWNKGAFEEGSEGGYAPGAPLLAATSAQRAAMAANTARHLRGEPAAHVVVCGLRGSGKSWLLWEATLAAGRSEGLRLVEVPPSELPNILDIARGCARYPRVRFVLVADHVELPLRGGLASDLAAGLSRAGGSGWPENTLLYLGVASSSTVSYADPAVSRCGLLVTTDDLHEAGWLAALGELAGEAGGSAAPTGEAAKAAVAWAVAHGGLNLRTAALCSRLAAPGAAGSG